MIVARIEPSVTELLADDGVGDVVGGERIALNSERRLAFLLRERRSGDKARLFIPITAHFDPFNQHDGRSSRSLNEGVWR